LLAGARGFYLSLLERVFHIKILCLRAVISFSFFVIAYRFYNTSPAVPGSGSTWIPVGFWETSSRWWGRHRVRIRELELDPHLGKATCGGAGDLLA
jgi:hypothetical protein